MNDGGRWIADIAIVAKTGNTTPTTEAQRHGEKAGFIRIETAEGSKCSSL
jgi:hypothetical protein